MKTMNWLILTKTAMKCFFDIDPVITEHLVELACHQGWLLRKELVQAIELYTGPQLSGRLLPLTQSSAYPAAA